MWVKGIYRSRDSFLLNPYVGKVRARMEKLGRRKNNFKSRLKSD